MTPHGEAMEKAETLPFIIDYLPGEVEKKALVELKETAENRAEGLENLKLMAKDNKSTSGIDFHDDFLLQFLRYSKFNVTKSFKRLQNFVELQRNNSSLFKGVPPEDLVTKASYECVTILPRRCTDGCTIVLTRIGKFDPDEIEFENFKRILMALIVQPLRDTLTQINGFKFIYDFKDTSFKHLKLCTPQNLLFHHHASLECLPGRYKQVHFVNHSIVLKALWTIVRHLISSKIRSRVHFHSEPSELLKYFPSSVLPDEYGGELKDYYMTDYITEANKMYGKCTMEGQPNYF